MLTFHAWHAQQPPPRDQIALRSLRCSATAGFDAWGRPVSAAKPSPVDISLTLHLRHPFASAAAADSLDASTVNYGTLAKALLTAVDQSASVWHAPAEFNDLLVASVLDVVKSTTDVLTALELDVRYTKAAHLAAAVAFRTRILYGPGAEQRLDELALDRCSLPALIGIHPHERRMKQMLHATVTVDRAALLSPRSYELEQLVAKTVEESAFLTLEALAVELAERVLWLFAGEGRGVVVSVEKPSAVVAADAPRVQVWRDGESVGRRKEVIVPFPLEGRLDEFLGGLKVD